MADVDTEGQAYDPRILVFSTNNISDPGIDLAGSSHMHYSPKVMVINLPCTSAIKPSWILYAMEQGFDGVFIAADGEECAYLPDCAERTAGIMPTAQDTARGEGLRAAARAHGRDLLRLRGAVHQLHARVRERPCPVWDRAERRPHEREAKIRRARRRQRHRRHGVGAQARRHGLQGPRRREGAQRRRQDDPAQQGLPHARLRQLHLHAEDGRDHPSSQHRRDDLRRGARASAATATATAPSAITPRSSRSPSSSTRPPAPAAGSARWPATSPYPTSTTPTWCRGGRRSSPSRRRCRRRPSSSREGVSPCTYECPAGIKAHGYVARVRSGEYDQAFDLVLETTPLVGSLGRACYAPCEGECTRGELEGPLPIRRLKRFIADQRYGQAEPEDRGEARAERQEGRRRRLGPGRPDRRLAARPQGLRRQDLRGGRARRRVPALGIPAYRLPNEVVDDDIANVTAIGVEIETGVSASRIRRSSRTTASTPSSWRRARTRQCSCACPARTRTACMSALTFLADVKLGKNVDLAGSKVLVVGGGNVAIDAARTARRLGAAEVHQASLECCEDMPAHDFEVEEAKAEGITLHDGWGVNHFTGDGKVESAVLKVCTCVFDPTGRFAPEYDESQQQTRRLRRRHRRRRHGRRHRGVRPRDQPQPDAQGRRRHAADRGAAHLRRRRRRHRPDDDHHRRRPGPPRGLHDRPLPPGRGPGRGCVRRGAPRRRQEDVLARQDVYDRREPLESHRRDERRADRLQRDRGAR